MWVLFWIQCYGPIEGGHHKAWLLDQVARILHGTKVILKLATFECEGYGTEEGDGHFWNCKVCEGTGDES